jgi:PAS domain S-box-containing protein
MKRLINNVEQLSQVLNSIANGITVQDPSGKLVFVNEMAARMMNCDSPEEALEKGGAEIVKEFKYFNEQDQPVSVADLPGRLALSGVDEPEMIVGFTSKKHPEMRWTSIKAMPIFDADGKVMLAVNVLQDVTRLKQAERELKEANERITGLMEEVLIKQIETAGIRLKRHAV